MTRHNDVQQACTGYEFAAGTVRGIRQWAVNGDRLIGLADNEWMPGENQAKCTSDVNGWVATIQIDLASNAVVGSQLRQSMPDHADPIDPRCTCGFYAYHHPDFLASALFPVVGVIDGYGKTTIGTKGFRCEKARILAVVKPGDRDMPGASSCDCEACVKHFNARRQVYQTLPHWIDRNYPGVRVFDTVEEMLAAFPLGDIPAQVTP